MRLITICLIAVLITFSAPRGRAASDCSPKDFNTELGEPFDQGDSGWCYAHSAAACISQVLHKRVSPGALAAAYISFDPKRLSEHTSAEVKKYLKEHPEVIESFVRRPLDHYQWEKAFSPDYAKTAGVLDIGGDEDATIILANREGLCEYGKFPSSDDEYMKALRELEQFHSDKTCGTCDGTEGPDSYCSGDTEDIAPYRNRRDYCLHSEKHIKRTIHNWVKAKCGDHIRPKSSLIPIKVKVANDLDDYRAKLASGELKLETSQIKLFAEINRNLNRGRISAVGYDYCDHGKVIPETGECAVVRLNEKSASPRPAEDHSALITARKMIAGKCHYFLRNHLGQTCNFYHEPFNDPSYCDEKAGGLWLDPSDLKSLYSVISIR